MNLTTELDSEAFYAMHQVVDPYGEHGQCLCGSLNVTTREGWPAALTAASCPFTHTPLPTHLLPHPLTHPLAATPSPPTCCHTPLPTHLLPHLLPHPLAATPFPPTCCSV